MNSHFCNTEVQTFYDKNGYVTLPLLSIEEVNELLDTYKELRSGLEGSKFYTSHTSPDIDYKKKVDVAIRKVIGSKLDGIFVNHKPVFGFYLVRSNEESSDGLDLHLDWQFVDERKYVGFNLWVPLVNITENNGAVYVIPGSHKQIKVLRGYNTPNPVHLLDRKVDEKLFRTVTMKAGEALIFDLRLLHGAWPNTTNEERIVAGMVAIPKEAEILHFWASKEAREHLEVEVYEMDPEFYMHNYDGSKPPADRLVGVWTDEHRELTIQNIQQAYGIRTSWLSRMLKRNAV